MYSDSSVSHQQYQLRISSIGSHILKNRRRSSPEAKNGNAESAIELQNTLCAIVERSNVRGLKTEELKDESKREPSDAGSGPSSSSASVMALSPSSSATMLDADPANAALPPYDLLMPDQFAFSPAIQSRKFFTDVRPLDRLLARVVRPGVAVLHVELVCMLTRFRRTLLAFMRGRLVPVPFDRTKRFYNINDYISTTVVSVSPNSEELELEIDEEEAILTQQGIPAYCRDFDRSSFDSDPHLSLLRDNPSLPALLGVKINAVHSGLRSLHAKQLQHAQTAADMRRKQATKLAMVHVSRGAELTRENKCFEAIQCFNKALAVDVDCADAYVGRGAACAGNRNFPAALADLEKAIELQPNHRNANKYRIEVLHTYAKELERAGQLEDARQNYAELLELCPGFSQALEALDRLRPPSGNRFSELVELSDSDDDEEQRVARKRSEGSNSRIGHENEGLNGHAQQQQKRRESMSAEEALRNRRKLAEMEAFIAKLKGGNGSGGGRRK